MRIFLSFLTSLLFCFYSNAQDTVKLMQYNLLNYGVNSSYCTPTNNNVDEKNTNLSIIIKYAKPDILTVNEISSDPYYHQYLLDHALNVDGVSYYSKAAFTNYAGSEIINMLYYNAVKFTLKSQKYITTSVRDINFYTLYYNSSDLATTHDTAFITCISAHLKAGNTPADEADRATMTFQLMYHLSNLNVDNNYTVSGDFNVYSGSEQSFQNLINFSNPIVRFNDPVNQVGNWNNNSAYALYHTQSTHTVGDCAAGGGMDDRFDFILISNNIKNGVHHYTSIPSSYWAIGQDGNRFNQTINNPVNNSVPLNVANALYGMSDHLPVILKLKVDKTIGLPEELNSPVLKISYTNPVSDKLEININLKEKTDLNIQVVSLWGQLVYQSQYKNCNTNFNCEIPTAKLQNGIYFMKISDEKNRQITRKIIKCNSN
jgi:hypothetical protein